MTSGEETLSESKQMETTAKQKFDRLNSELSILNNLLKLQRLSASAKAAASQETDMLQVLKSVLAALKS